MLGPLVPALQVNKNRIAVYAKARYLFMQKRRPSKRPPVSVKEVKTCGRIVASNLADGHVCLLGRGFYDGISIPLGVLGHKGTI